SPHASVSSSRSRVHRHLLSFPTRRSSDLVVKGPGRVALCPCPDPPITLGFTTARASPADLVVENPTLRAGGVPVAWLPYFWLRSDRKSTRLNSSHQIISYAVFCLKKKNLH